MEIRCQNTGDNNENDLQSSRLARKEQSQWNRSIATHYGEQRFRYWLLWVLIWVHTMRAMKTDSISDKPV